MAPAGGRADRPGAALNFSFRRRRGPGATRRAWLLRGESGLAELGGPASRAPEREGTTATDPDRVSEPARPQVRRWRRFFEPSGTSKSLPRGGIGDTGSPECRSGGAGKGGRAAACPALASPLRTACVLGNPGS